MLKQFWIFCCLIGGCSLFAQSKPLEEWIQKLKHPSWKVREEATRMLLKQGENARKSLESSLQKTTDPEIRWRLQYVLQFFLVSEVSEQEEEILFLIQNLYDRNAAVVYKSSQQLQNIGSVAIPYLEQELKQVTEYKTRIRLKDLIQIITQQTQMLSENTSQDPLEKEFQKYMANLRDPNKYYLGLTLLKAMGEPALPFLIQEVQKKSDNYKIRMNLIQLIGVIYQKEAVDALVQLLETEKDPQVSEYANMYLRKMTGQNVSRIRWKEWWEKNREEFQFPTRK